MAIGNRLIAAGSAFEMVATALNGRPMWAAAGASVLTLALLAEFSQMAEYIAAHIVKSAQPAQRKSPRHDHAADEHGLD